MLCSHCMLISLHTTAATLFDFTCNNQIVECDIATYIHMYIHMYVHLLYHSPSKQSILKLGYHNICSMDMVSIHASKAEEIVFHISFHHQ